MFATFEDDDSTSVSDCMDAFYQAHQSCVPVEESAAIDAMNREARRVQRPLYERSAPGVVAR